METLEPSLGLGCSSMVERVPGIPNAGFCLHYSVLLFLPIIMAGGKGKVWGEGLVHLRTLAQRLGHSSAKKTTGVFGLCHPFREAVPWSGGGRLGPPRWQRRSLHLTSEVGSTLKPPALGSAF